MTNLETIIVKQAKQSHARIGINVDKNQTIVKGQIYGYIGSGYSYGNGRGYYTFSIVKAKTNDYFRLPAHWNKEVFTVIDGCGRVHGGSNGGNTEYDKKRSKYEEEYPGLIWV